MFLVMKLFDIVNLILDGINYKINFIQVYMLLVLVIIKKVNKR